jgi:hypothetical protein
MCGKRFRGLLAVSSCLLASAASVPAQALTFTLNNIVGAAPGSQARMGFDAAAFFWSRVFKDNVNVSLDIGFAPLGAGILGSTGHNALPISVGQTYLGLYFDQTSVFDNVAVSNLPGTSAVVGGVFNGLPQIGMRVNQASNVAPASTDGIQYYSDQATRFDLDGSANNIALDVSTANLKALGFTLDSSGHPFAGADGDITFNSKFAFDFDPTDGVDAGKYDFVAVAVHEIGHALGFLSGVDYYDQLTLNVAPNANPNLPGVLDDYAVGSVLDLFRYNGAGELDWSTSSDAKFFSLDGTDSFPGGSGFSLGLKNGDLNQASHWKAPSGGGCSLLLGIMNPYLCKGSEGAVSGLDLVAMDTIGWDLNFATLSRPGFTGTTSSIFSAYLGSVPEPASWAQMIVGFGLLGGMMRRPRRRVALASR